MAILNERLTEEFVRSHFRAYDEQVKVEEQSSENSAIRECLSRASKQGDGVGYPDFIVSIKEKRELLVVIECKADHNKHKSESGDKMAEYAVDGVLHYASYLSRSFDVLAIAVSGSDIGQIIVSHYLHLNNTHAPKPIFGGQLLSPEDYVFGYCNTDDKLHQDLDKLRVSIHSLNKRLHKNKVAESNRALLVGEVLIALQQDAFKHSYRLEQNAERLAESVTRSAIAQLQDSRIDTERLNLLDHKFSFLKTERFLLANDNELNEIIKEIETEVDNFTKNHQYVDVMGELYVEFLRYANQDKGLGIVLTPPHITDLFAQIVRVDRDSVVYDNCAGTGGFLISAMKRMIEAAQGSREIENSIKSSQLYGVEVQSSIYPLAVSNMFIHQDGKSNIEQGDCFSEKVIEKVRSKRPTIGMLNPPYKSDKAGDTEELKFVANNLDCLEPNGTCVAIVPMQSAISSSKEIVNWRKKLMKEHKLEAVLSMPDELFFNSKVNAVTCIMVFTAKRPHQSGDTVFLGYFKDDGFIKRRVGGRIDYHRRWPEVSRDWLDNYKNKRNRPGLCVNVELEAKDEWAAEAYMETDYSQLNDQLFEDALREYSLYLFANHFKSYVSKEPRERANFEFDHRRLKYFDLMDLFQITGTKTTPPDVFAGEDSKVKALYPYVRTQRTNNAVHGFYDNFTEKGGVLTVESAVTGFCTYQSRPFSASDHVEKLIPKFQVDPYIALFLTTTLNLEQYRYNYGRKCSQSRMKRAKIKLPCDDLDRPDWDWMRRYMQSIRYSSNLE